MKRLHHEDGLSTAQICETVRTIMNRKLEPHSQFSYLGNKGGSTIFILNEALYSKDIHGNTFDMALFIDDYSGTDHPWLSQKIDLFLQQFLVDPAFRQKVADTLAP
jgi:D-alanyl-D-alanine carboxypeptidase